MRSFFLLIWFLFSVIPTKIYATSFGSKLEAAVAAMNQESYFILYINTNASINAIASGTINSYKGIRNLDTIIPIYCVFLNHTVKDLASYAKKHFYLDTTKDQHLHFLEQESLNVLLYPPSALTHVFFVKNKELIYAKDGKHHFIDQQNLPINTHWDKKKFPVLKYRPKKYTIPQPIQSITYMDGITRQHSIVLNSEHQFSGMDAIAPINEQELVILLDGPNKLVKFDLKTGNEIITHSGIEDPIAFFANIYPDLTNAEIDSAIHFENNFLKVYNRKSYYIFGYSYQKENSKQSLGSGLQVGFPLRKDHKIPNAYGKGKDAIIKKGEIFGIGLDYFEVLGDNWNTTKMYRVKDNFLDLSNPGNHANEKAPYTDGNLFWQNDTTFLASQYYYNDNNIPIKSYHFIGQYRLNNLTGMVDFVQDLAPLLSKSQVKKFDDWMDRTYFFTIGNQTYTMLDMDNAIWNINHPEAIAFVGNKDMGKSLRNESDILNYTVLSVDAYKDKVYFLYQFQNKRCYLEIKDVQLKTTTLREITELRGIKENKNNDFKGIQILDGKLYVKYLKDKKITVSVYNIEY